MEKDDRKNRENGNGERGAGFDWASGSDLLEDKPGPAPLDDDGARELLTELAESVKRGEVSEAAAAGSRRRRKGKRLVKPEQARRRQLTPIQRVLVLDVWLRSGLSAGDFAPLVQVRRVLCDAGYEYQEVQTKPRNFYGTKTERGAEAAAVL